MTYVIYHKPRISNTEWKKKLISLKKSYDDGKKVQCA